MDETHLMAASYLTSRNRTKLRCPKCHQREMARIARAGFLRQRLLPLLGIFPWQCALCGQEALLRRRGSKSRPIAIFHDAETQAGEAIVSPGRMTR